MGQVSFKELAPEVLSVAAACPSPTIVRSLRNAAVELGTRASCMRYTMDPQTVFTGMPSVELNTPCDMVVSRIENLSFDGTRLSPTSVTMLDADVKGWRSQTGAPTSYIRSQNSLDAVVLYPVPAVAGVLTGEVAVVPARGSAEMPEVYLDKFQNALIDGALSRLLSVPSAPWYNRSAAAYHARRFEGALDDARRVADGDDTPKLRKVKYGGM